jgi:hypothetical protein
MTSKEEGAKEDQFSNPFPFFGAKHKYIALRYPL